MTNLITACPWCGNKEQRTDVRGTCAKCSLPWDIMDFLDSDGEKLTGQHIALRAENERLSRPWSEREPPHCQSCNCSVQEKLPPRSEPAAILHYELDEWKNAGGPTLTVVNAIIDLIQHAIDATNVPDSQSEPRSQQL